MFNKHWSVNGGKTYHRSGNKIYLSEGDYTIIFSESLGYIKPNDENISIVSGEHKQITVKYQIINTTVSISVDGLMDSVAINSNLVINNLTGNVTI